MIRTTTGKEWVIHYPKTHEELYEKLKISEICIWVWPPDALKCDDITWTDHSGADKIINKWINYIFS